LLIQIGTNFTNDLFDHLKGSDTKERKGPVRVLAAGLISEEEMRGGIIAVFGLAFLLGLYLVWCGGWIVLAIGICSIIAGMAYTAGPYPLAYHALGDLFVFIFFGVVATMGTYFVQAYTWTWQAFAVSLPMGALITEILVVNNYRDTDEDRRSNKITLSVKFGKAFSRWQYLLLMVMAYLVPIVLLFQYRSYYLLIPFLSLPLAYKTTRMVFTLQGEVLNNTLALTGKLVVVYGLLFSAGIIL
jgi:1,4-dihydroxy-2-naphthoate octaprenyltransferase